MYINFNNCDIPTANFSISDSTICLNDCIAVYDSSLQAISWQWAFDGGDPSASVQQNPDSICFNSIGNCI